MSFEFKIGVMADSAEWKARKALQNGIQSVAVSLTAILKTGSWQAPTQRQQKDLDVAIGQSHDAAAVLDAAECIQRRLLTAKTAKVVDLRLLPDSELGKSRSWRHFELVRLRNVASCTSRGGRRQNATCTWGGPEALQGWTCRVMGSWSVRSSGRRTCPFYSPQKAAMQRLRTSKPA